MGNLNVDAPFGLTPLRHAHGGAYTGGVNAYFATGATGLIGIGDPVVIDGSANTSEFAGYAPGSLPTVALVVAGDGNPITGICVGVQAVTRESTTYRSTSTDRIIWVADDPDLVFLGRTDAAGTDWAATDVGSYANLLAGAASSTTGRSGIYLDTTDGPDSADVSNQLYIVRLHPAPGNDIGDYSLWEVMINNHQLANVADAGRITGV